MTNNKGLLQRVYDAVLNRQEKPAESRANYLSDDGGVYTYNAGMPSFQGGKIKRVQRQSKPSHSQQRPGFLLLTTLSLKLSAVLSFNS